MLNHALVDHVVHAFVQVTGDDTVGLHTEEIGAACRMSADPVYVRIRSMLVCWNVEVTCHHRQCRAI